MAVAYREGRCPADGCNGALRNGMPGRFERFCTGNPRHTWKKHDLIWGNYEFTTSPLDVRGVPK